MEEYHWSITQFIVGVLGAGIGFVMVWKADWLLQNFGRVPFAERFLTTEGGTRLFYKFIGILVMIIGMMHATGLLAPTMKWIISSIFSGYVTPDETVQ